MLIVMKWKMYEIHTFRSYSYFCDDGLKLARILKFAQICSVNLFFYAHNNKFGWKIERNLNFSWNKLKEKISLEISVRSTTAKKSMPHPQDTISFWIKNTEHFTVGCTKPLIPPGAISTEDYTMLKNYIHNAISI